MYERREGRGERRPPNPAKVFLTQYRGLKMRYDEIIEQIALAEERATNTAARISPAKVQSGRIHDTVCETAISVVDMSGVLMETAGQIQTQLRTILHAIDSVPDAMQQTILTKRYISGKSWKEICSEIGYEKTRVNELHGWALVSVKKWMEGQGI